jgi:transcriptional regulator with XRE-family HTH domain
MTREEVIGKNILLRRLERGYSQERLAALIHWSQKEISRYERGEIKRPNYNFLKAVAVVFGIGVEVLEDEDYVKMSTGKRAN